MHKLLRILCLKLYLGVLGAWQALKEQVWDRHRTPKNLPRGDGQTIVITGGNRGIGFEAVRTFLKLGYRVIIGCRNPDKCSKDLEKFVQKLDIESSETSGSIGSYECLELDLLSLESVRRFAEAILEKNVPIHVLANNAGVMFGPRRETKEGFESHFVTNYLGHFLLTSLLLKRLKEASTPKRKSRIVNVSSVAHFAGFWIDFDDLQAKKFYSPEGAYGNSKAAQILFTNFLNDRLAGSLDGNNVVVNCVHPGVVNTGLYQHARFIPMLLSHFMKTPRQGGDSILHACLSQDIEGQGGLYLDNGRPAKAAEFTRYLYNQVMLWNASLKMVGLDDFF